MLIRSLRIVGVVLALGLVRAPTTLAQIADDSTPSAPADQWPVAVWLSGCLGVAFINASKDDAVGEVLRANALAGPLLLTEARRG